MGRNDGAGHRVDLGSYLSEVGHEQAVELRKAYLVEPFDVYADRVETLAARAEEPRDS